MPNLMPSDFHWDGYFWKTTTRLAAWRGFQSRRSAYGGHDSVAPSDGLVALVFAPEGRDDTPIRAAEVELANWAIKHEEEMQHALLATLLPHYTALRPQYLNLLDDEALMPDVTAVDQFKSLIGLHSLNVHQIEKNGCPYVGFELGCTWDAEHGLGVLMHGTHVVEIGGADTAILLWIAERDANKGAARA